MQNLILSYLTLLLIIWWIDIFLFLLLIQFDYLRKISLKMLKMETQSFNATTNSLPSNSADHNKKSPNDKKSPTRKRPLDPGNNMKKNVFFLWNATIKILLLWTTTVEILHFMKCNGGNFAFMKCHNRRHVTCITFIVCTHVLYVYIHV